MITQINGINLNKTQYMSVVRQNKTNSDVVSFGCNPTQIITTTNPQNTKKLFYVLLNNSYHKTKNIFKKAFNRLFLYLFAFAKPGEILMDKNTITLLNLKDNKIMGGIILQKNPQTNSLNCVSLIQDEVNQTPKERLRSVFNLTKHLCKKCDKDNITKIIFQANNKNKKIQNLFRKFALKKGELPSGQIKYEAYIDRLKEFLEETKSKHNKLFKL